MLTPFPEAGFAPMAGTAAGTAADTGSTRFLLTAANPCFEGHFDTAPILPGVAHIALALAARAAQAGAGGTLIGLRNVRFTRTLRPDDELEVVLSAGQEPHSVRFEIRCGGDAATSGLLIFAAAHGAP